VDKQQAHNPLHGITLKQIVTHLVEYFGWEKLGNIIKIRCFNSDPCAKAPESLQKARLKCC
jgi:uncharacterized protein (DUF2132 family)